MTTKPSTSTASTAQPAKAGPVAAKKPTQNAAKATKAAGAAKSAQTAQEAVQPTKQAANVAAPAVEAASVSPVQFYRLRKSGSARHLPVLSAGSPERAAAQVTTERLSQGESAAQVANELGVSVSTVRRQVSALAFTQQVEAGAFSALIKKAKDGKVVFPATVKDEA